MCRPCASSRTASMSDQCTRRPPFTPVRPNTKPSSVPSGANAPADTPPSFCPTSRIAAGTRSVNATPQVASWRRTAPARSSCVASSRMTIPSARVTFFIREGTCRTREPTIPPGVCVMRKLAAVVAVLATSSIASCRSPVTTGAATNGTLYDMVITNGRIVDGSGNAWFWGDVGVRDDRIARIAPRGALASAPAAKHIDAHGLAVTPGFIDIQAQSYENFMVGDGRALSMVTQGITTAILGEGDTPAPVNEKMLAATTDTSARRLEQRFTGPHGFGQWLDFMQRRGLAENVGSFVGAGTVRVYAKGEAVGTPTAAELDTMRAMVRRAMTDGAFGVGSALIYPPGAYASTAELIEAARAERRKRAARGGGRSDPHRARWRSAGGDLPPEGGGPRELAEDGVRDREDRLGADRRAGRAGRHVHLPRRRQRVCGVHPAEVRGRREVAREPEGSGDSRAREGRPAPRDSRLRQPLPRRNASERDGHRLLPSRAQAVRRQAPHRDRAGDGQGLGRRTHRPEHRRGGAAWGNPVPDERGQPAGATEAPVDQMGHRRGGDRSRDDEGNGPSPHVRELHAPARPVRARGARDHARRRGAQGHVGRRDAALDRGSRPHQGRDEGGHSRLRSRDDRGQGDLREAAPALDRRDERAGQRRRGDSRRRAYGREARTGRARPGLERMDRPAVTRT